MRPPRHRDAQAHARATVVTGDLPRFGSRGAPQAFGHKLAAIIANESPSVVRWNKAGTAFKIHDPKALQTLLGKYFRHANYSSFQRQMNLYGFKRIIEGPEAGAHMHPSFLRDQPELLVNVRRAVGPVVPPSPASTAAPVPAVEATPAPASKKAKKAPRVAAEEVGAIAEAEGATPAKTENQFEEAVPSSNSAAAANSAAANAAAGGGDSVPTEADEEPLPFINGAAAEEEALSASISSMGVSSRFFFFDDNELERDAILALSDDEDSTLNDLGELPPALRRHADAAAQQIAASRGGCRGAASPVNFTGAYGPLQNVTAAAAAAAAGLLVPPKCAADSVAEDDEMAVAAAAAAAAAASSRPGTPSKSPGLVEQLTSAIDTGFTSLLSGLRGERTSTGGGNSSGRPSLDRMSFSQMSFDMDDVPEKMQQSSPTSLSFSGGVDLMRSNSSRDWDNIFTESLQGFAEFFAV